MNDLSTHSKLLTQPTKTPVMRYLLSMAGGLVFGALLVVGGEYAAGYRVVDRKAADYYEEFLRFMDNEETHRVVRERMEMEEKHEQEMQTSIKELEKELEAERAKTKELKDEIHLKALEK